MKSFKFYLTFCMVSLVLAVAGIILLFSGFNIFKLNNNSNIDYIQENPTTNAETATVRAWGEFYNSYDSFYYWASINSGGRGATAQVAVGGYAYVTIKCSPPVSGGRYYDSSQPMYIKATLDNKHYALFYYNGSSVSIPVYGDTYLDVVSYGAGDYIEATMTVQTKNDSTGAYEDSDIGGTATATQNSFMSPTFTLSESPNPGYVFEGFYEVLWSDPNTYIYVSSYNDYWVNVQNNYGYYFARFSKAVKFNVVYNSNYGTVQTISEQFTQNQGQYLRTNSFSRTGYTFKGWSTSSTSTSPMYSDGQWVSFDRESLLTLYAVWSPNQYTVTADANTGRITSGNSYWTGNSLTMTRSIAYDSTYNPLPSVSKTGYSCTGWKIYKNNTYGNSVSNSTRVQTAENHTIRAIWSPNTYSINYYMNDGASNYTTQSVVYDSYVTFTQTFNRFGYILKGWATTANGEVSYNLDYYFGKYQIDGNLNLYAVWEETWLLHTEEPTKVGGVYQVSTPENLAWLANYSSYGQFVQTCKIDLSEYTWKPAANFTGVFDGNGYPITNVNVINVWNVYENNHGLFGRTTGATLKNITLLSGNIEGDYNVGGIVGYAKNTEILNCLNMANVSGESPVGGIAGTIIGTTKVISCYNYGAVSGYNGVGGLVGWIEADDTSPENPVIRNSLANCSVSASFDCAGLVGYSFATFKMERCIFDGVLSEGINMFIGYSSSGEIVDCYSRENSNANVYVADNGIYKNCKYSKNGEESEIGDDFSNWVNYNGRSMPIGVYWIASGIYNVQR